MQKDSIECPHCGVMERHSRIGKEYYCHQCGKTFTYKEAQERMEARASLRSEHENIDISGRR